MAGKGRESSPDDRREDVMYEIDFSADNLAEENARGGWSKKDHPVGGTPRPTPSVGSKS